MKNTVKKVLCAVLSVLMMLSLFASCDKQGERMAELKEIAEANTTKNLLETYDSILVTLHDINGTEHGYYMDQEIGHRWWVYADENGAERTDSEVTTATYQAGYEGISPYTVFYFGGEIDASWYKNVFLDPEVFEIETVTSVVEENGLITYTTKLAILDLVDYGYMASADTIDYYYITKYVVDADTLHFRSITESFYNEKDEVISRYTRDVEYNVDRPDLAKTVMQMQETDDVCTVSVVTGMDTDAEATTELTIPKGNLMYFYWYGDYTSVFTDRECTKDFEDGSLVNEDITIYLK